MSNCVVPAATEGIGMRNDNSDLLPPDEDIMSIAYEIDDHLHTAIALLTVAQTSGMCILSTDMQQYFLSGVKEEVSAAMDGHNRAARFHQNIEP